MGLSCFYITEVLIAFQDYTTGVAKLRTMSRIKSWRNRCSESTGYETQRSREVRIGIHEEGSGALMIYMCHSSSAPTNSGSWSYQRLREGRAREEERRALYKHQMCRMTTDYEYRLAEVQGSQETERWKEFLEDGFVSLIKEREVVCTTGGIGEHRLERSGWERSRLSRTSRWEISQGPRKLEGNLESLPFCERGMI